MKHVLVALLFAALLSGCALNVPPSATVGIHLPELPSQVTSCGKPGLVPDRVLTRAEVEQLWARDRAALVKCGLNLNALIRFYTDLALRLSAADERP